MNTSSVFLTSVIEAKEGRDTRVHDIPNAFVQAKNEDQVIMKIKGKAAEYLVRCDPRLYRKHVLLENGVTVLFVELKKALYGQLKAALLFYKKLVKDLKKLGFKINPYDPCVANRMVNGSQQTVCWHVDDVKSSHVDPQVQQEFEDWLIDTYDRDPYGKIVGKLKRCTGKKLDYLGMIINFENAGEVKFEMVDYTKKMVHEFEEATGELMVPKTPAAEHLFQTRDDSKKLEENESIIFHNATAKALYLCKRARPDIQTAVAFLTTRVKAPDCDDWKKLSRMMGYLKGTLNLVLTLSDTGVGGQWWMDAANGVHPDLRGHTGGTFSLGKGSVFSKSTKQKLNTASSTEAELVGTFECMAKVIWTNYFLKAQGYEVGNTVVYQDNMSAILMEKNGKSSSSKRTKHINMRYFFIQDRWKKGEFKIEHCPTDEMLADFFTKPLQGKKFMYFRDRILGIE